MCLPALGAAGAVSAFTSVAGLAISAVSTVAGIMQSQQSAQMQAQQAAQQAALAKQQQTAQANYQYQVAQQQTAYQRAQAQTLYQGQQRAYTAAQRAYQQQVFNNNRSANLVYQTEQMRLAEKRQELAFKSQEIYAKQIGDAGRVLATGQSGQSVGALVRDAQAQGGFAQAKEDASFLSAANQTQLAQVKAGMENESANNQAFSALPLPPIPPTPIPNPIAPPGATIGVNTRF